MEKLISKVLNVSQAKDEETLKDNANKNGHVFSSQRDLIAGVVCKDIALNSLLPKHLAKAHIEGLIHIHDLDVAPVMPQTNCCLVNLQDMFEHGFKMNNTMIEKPKGISTAMTLASQVVMAVGSLQYGGISFDRFDEVMSEYVTMSYMKHLTTAESENVSDKIGYAKRMIRKEVYDACQCFEYQVNSMTCTSGQSPFLSIGYGLGVSWEERLLQEMIMQVRIDGLGKEKITAIFPKLIYSIKDGVNHKPGDVNYDIKQIALRCSAKRMYPDILNYDQTVKITGGFKASMSCRSFLPYCEDDQGNEFYSGRTNLGVTTISLPLIALKSKGDKNTFYKLVDEALSLAKEACEFRLGYLSKVQAKQAPILYTEGALMRLKPDEYVLPHLIERGSSISVGYIGLNEVANCMINTPDHIIDSQEKQNFCLELLKHIDKVVSGWKEETGIGYSTYATPSESQCKRLLDCAVNDFGVVKGVTDKEYFTNSFHLEATKQADPYSRIDFESQFIPFSSGGFISYGEFPNMNKNLEALENVWDFSYHNTPYYAINCPADNCFDCGYEGEFLNKSKGFVCPSCSNNDPERMNVVRRVSGYLGNPNTRPFNDGKSKEVQNRVKNM